MKRAMAGLQLVSRLLLACGLACAAGVVQAAAGNPIEVRSQAGRVSVWPALRIVASADRRLLPHQAAQLAAADNAISVDSPDRVLGRGTVPYWALFSISNPEAFQLLRLLALEVTTQFDIRLYECTGTGAWRQVESLADAAAGRFGGGTMHPVWVLALGPQQTRELLLRVEGPSIVRFPLYVYNPVSLAEKERTVHLLAGVALGSCPLIIAFIGWPRRYLKDSDQSVPLFICMLIADVMGALWLTGFFAELFPAVPERNLSAVGFAAYATLLGCGSLHCCVYLDLAAWAQRADRLLRMLGWFLLGLAPWFSLAFPVAARIVLVWGGTAVALILVVVSGMAARRRVPQSGFIAAAWLTYLSVGLYFLLARVIDNPLLWSSSTVALVQATVIAILFGFAMSQRLVRLRNVLEAARLEAVNQLEKTAALMRERSLLFAATNHDLRQPLLGVSVFANLLKSADTPAERQAHAQKLDLALAEVDDLIVGIQQLAAFSESPHRHPSQSAKLDDLLVPIIEEYRSRAQYKHITIRYVPSRLSIATHAPTSSASCATCCRMPFATPMRETGSSSACGAPAACAWSLRIPAAA